jgi:excisionase family DNA binding protein
MSVERDESHLCNSKFFDNRKPQPKTENVLSFEPKWLTTDETAQFLRISISALKTMIYRGQIQPYKLGRRNRFLMSDLDRLITPPKKSEV